MKSLEPAQPSARRPHRNFMALLQISEPGQTPDPHQRRIAVGIDLGTTHSLVAAVRHGVAECLPDEQGRVLLPSVVRYLAGGGRQIGQDALIDAVADAENTIASAKRLMGRRLADIVGRDQLPYRLLDQPGMVTIQTAHGEKSPVEVSAEILATLRYRAEDTFNDDLYGIKPISTAATCTMVHAGRSAADCTVSQPRPCMVAAASAPSAE